MLKILDELHTLIIVIVVFGVLGLSGSVFIKHFGLIFKTILLLGLWVTGLIVIGQKVNQDLAVGLAILSVIVFFAYSLMNPESGASINDVLPPKAYPPGSR